MTSDCDLDAFLAAPDEDDVPTDDAFVHAVMRRVERQRARRRTVFGVTGGLAGMAACVASVVALPVPVAAGGPDGTGSVISILVLVALCAMAWIGPVSDRTPGGKQNRVHFPVDE